MKLLSSISRDTAPDMLPGLRKRMTEDNIKRGRVLAAASVFSVFFYALLNIGAASLKLSEQYAFFTYLFVYALLIVLNAAYLLLTHKLKTLDHLTEQEVRQIHRWILVYLVLFGTWCSVVSVLTQPMYGQITMYMVGTTVCSITFLIDDRELLIQFYIPAIVLALGLPYTQPSKDVLLGNYANLLFFFAACWIMSRISFRKYCSDYTARTLLERANGMLERQMRQNELMTMRLEQANGRLRMLSQCDELTGACNRRSFRDFVSAALETQTQSSRLSVIMLDVDHFKQYNDLNGHTAGDRLLVQISGQIRAELRKSEDTFVRWGGDEFLIASFSADEPEFTSIAENIRRRILSLPGPSFGKTAAKVTISCGICSLSVRGREDVSRCIELADRALYEAKSSGRNCIRIAPAGEATPSGHPEPILPFPATAKEAAPNPHGIPL